MSNRVATTQSQRLSSRRRLARALPTHAIIPANEIRIRGNRPTDAERHAKAVSLRVVSDSL
jgi:hypothetical protein